MKVIQNNNITTLWLGLRG